MSKQSKPRRRHHKKAKQNADFWVVTSNQAVLLLVSSVAFLVRIVRSNVAIVEEWMVDVGQSEICCDYKDTHITSVMIFMVFKIL